jgi:5-(carboxyamino)imidazole ribonucleotide synthase
MESTNVVGLLTIEFFLMPDGRVLVNELAPRPHNSGHVTIEASETSQFKQLALILTSQPMESVSVIKPGAMINLLGELWLGSKDEPNWNLASKIPETFLHLYGKKTAKRGRKMGHLTSLHRDPNQALTTLRALRHRLSN